MGKSRLKHLHIINVLLFSVVLLMSSSTLAFAAGGKMFFTAIVERDDQSHAQVVLEWGALEGEIPAEIVSFNLYRSTNGASHEQLATVPYQLATPSILAAHIAGDLSSRSASLINTLSRMSESQGGQPIDTSNVVKYLLNLLDPSEASHDPFMLMLLGRAHLSASIGQGLAFIDSTVEKTSDYQYLLTAVTKAGESLPIGQTDIIHPSVETILPAPTGLAQIRLSPCSALGAGRDDNQINFIWDIPTAPQDLGLKAVTYGYDLFWSATDMGLINFRSGIPSELHRVNPEPVVVAGQPLPEGPDSYLAKDGAENHTEGPAWKRGQSYFYYLAVKDIAGHYCQPVSPAELTVTDAMPPRAVWNAHSQEIKDPVDDITPRLALVWDAPTAVNFTRYYGGNRTICSADADEVCWVNSDQSCTSDTPRCADLAVDHYRILRFESPEAAADWGIDTDGDGWPDIVEKDPLNNTDSCDPDSHPAGISVPWHTAEVPSAWIATINPSDASLSRNISEMHRQIFYIDKGITDNNKVYWYKVIAVDKQGNQSPLSAPLRGVLYDRSQPEPVATMYAKRCSYSATRQSDCGIEPQTADTFLVLQDTTGEAVSYKLFQQCAILKDTTSLQLLANGRMDKNNSAHIKKGDLPQSPYILKCRVAPCAEGAQQFIVRFYDADGKVLASTAPFEITQICEFTGCVVLEKECSWRSKTTDDPYFIPSNPIKICLPVLKTGQSARVYYQTATGMSAFYTFNTAVISDPVCHDFDDLQGLTPADLCLGVRVFSANHVGSRMLYLGCMEMHATNDQPPPPPLLDPIESAESGLGKTLDLQWSMQAAGVGSYILKVTSEDHTGYDSLWNIDPDDSGRYFYTYPLDPTDVDKEFCFQLRALSTDMQASDWSIEQCGTWETGEPEVLGWPPVAEPDDGGDIGAFFLSTANDRQPVLVLSDDITDKLTRLSGCTDQITPCTEKSEVPCLRNSEFQFVNCPACSILRAEILTDTFIVYRQETGHDFVQISPLIEGFHCRTENHKEIVDFLQDPFIALLNVNGSTIKGVDPSDAAAIGGGVRILFKDRYPFKATAGNMIRYKLVSIHPETGEPEKIYTSNWITL